jgi:hypothetical protein
MCPSCIEGYIENLECDNVTKDERIKELEASESQLIGERDHFEDQVRDIDLALGGSGEWSNLRDCGVEAILNIAGLQAELANTKDKEREAKAEAFRNLIKEPATFLPECKYRNDHGTCCDVECKLYGQSCSKRCDCPEPKDKENE